MLGLVEGATARRGSLSKADSLPDSTILLLRVGSFELFIDKDSKKLFIKVINYRSKLLEIHNDDLWRIVNNFTATAQYQEQLRSTVIMHFLPKRYRELGSTMSFALFADMTNRSLIVQVTEYGANFIAIPRDALIDMLNSF